MGDFMGSEEMGYIQHDSRDVPMFLYVRLFTLNICLSMIFRSLEQQTLTSQGGS